jgi:excisionase family DNA binding protein
MYSIENPNTDQRCKTWLNSKEAADYLSISVENLRVKVSRGEVPVNGKLGRTLRFRREELDRLLISSLTRKHQ